MNQPQQSPQWQPQPQVTQPKKRLIPSLRAILFIVGIISILISYIIISGGNNSSAKSSSDLTLSNSPAKVGDTLTADNISCTVLSADGYSDLGGLIFITVRITNNSESEFHYYSSDFHIKTNSGKIMDTNDSEGLGEGALAPGGKAEGEIAFEIQDYHDAVLLWQPSGHENDLSIAWKLNLKS